MIASAFAARAPGPSLNVNVKAILAETSSRLRGQASSYFDWSVDSGSQSIQAPLLSALKAGAE